MKKVYLTNPRYIHSTEVFRVENTAYPMMAMYVPKTYKRVKMGLESPAHSLVDLMFSSNDYSKDIDLDIPSSDQGLIFCAGNTSFAGGYTLPQKIGTDLEFSLKIPTRQVTQIYAGIKAQQLGATGHISTDSSACSSSIKGLMDAWNLIQFYGFKRIGVLTVEEQVTSKMFDFFGQLKASIPLDKVDSGYLPSAFDSVNNGFYLGQGAAFVWLESEDSILKSGRVPVAELMGASSCGEDCLSSVGQRDDGQGFLRTIAKTFSISNADRKSIEYIKTHGTGTELNNLSESRALNEYFGNNFIATSFKPTIGHTLGSSGLLESLMFIDSTRNHIVPGIKNRTKHDELFLSQDLNCKVDRFLSISAGMGNTYSSALFNLEI